MRYYNDNFERITLEKKIKNNNLCIKVSAGLTEKECRKLLNGDLEWMKTHSSSLVQELYGKMKYQQLRPRVLVSYTREPYIYAAGNVRITLTGMYGPLCTTENFWKKVYDVETGQQCPGEMIMEVKYDAFLPGVIQNLIQTDG
ncbi:MAG: VTC domain-containing protein [Ruminococcus sp.]